MQESVSMRELEKEKKRVSASVGMRGIKKKREGECIYIDVCE